MKHTYLILWALIFFTLTSAKRPEFYRPVKSVPNDTIYGSLPTIQKNNEFNKAIGKQLKFEILIMQELDTLKPVINPKPNDK